MPKKYRSEEDWKAAVEKRIRKPVNDYISLKSQKRLKEATGRNEKGFAIGVVPGRGFSLGFSEDFS